MDNNLADDPAYKSFIHSLAEHSKAMSSLSFVQQRQFDSQFVKDHNTNHEIVYRIENVMADAVPIRVYIPKGTNLPVMMYFHGGGWVYGCVEDADAVCRRLANHLNMIIASVDYRLAPEFPFPLPLEDCYTATVWMAKNASKFGGDPNKFLVSGESAGGNLAAAVAIIARDKKGPKIAAQLLMYPAISSDVLDAIYDQCQEQHFITKDLMRFFWDMYAPNDKKNPYASLDLQSSLKDLPPTLILTAEHDPLSYDIKKYILQLKEANVPVIHKEFPGLIHGFLYIPLYTEAQKVAWTDEISRLISNIV